MFLHHLDFKKFNYNININLKVRDCEWLIVINNYHLSTESRYIGLAKLIFTDQQANKLQFYKFGLITQSATKPCLTRPN